MKSPSIQKLLHAQHSPRSTLLVVKLGLKGSAARWSFCIKASSALSTAAQQTARNSATQQTKWCSLF